MGISDLLATLVEMCGWMGPSVFVVMYQKPCIIYEAKNVKKLNKVIHIIFNL